MKEGKALVFVSRQFGVMRCQDCDERITAGVLSIGMESRRVHSQRCEACSRKNLYEALAALDEEE